MLSSWYVSDFLAKLLNWMVVGLISCICLLNCWFETLGNKHTSRSLFHVPLERNISAIWNILSWKSWWKPLEFGVGLSSNTWQTSIFVAVGEILRHKMHFLDLAAVFIGFLFPYTSPKKFIIVWFNNKQNPPNNEEDNHILGSQMDIRRLSFIKQ